MWPKEPIPDGDLLFYRIHKSDFVVGEIVPGAFRERGEGEAKGMSTDWEKYSTAIEAWNRSKIPTENLIVEFVAGKVREEGLEVAHDPLSDNRAHSLPEPHIPAVLRTHIRNVTAVVAVAAFIFYITVVDELCSLCV